MSILQTEMLPACLLVITRRISKNEDMLGFYALFAPSIYEGMHVAVFVVFYSRVIDLSPPYKVDMYLVQIIFESQNIYADS